MSLGRIAHERVSQLQADGVKFPEYDAQGARVDHYDAHGNVIADIDEVEIYLAYTTPLATRLDLPWQSRSMMFREDYVTAPMVETAFNRVQLLDQGELLRGNLLEQPMWTDFLQRAHSADYAADCRKVRCTDRLSGRAGTMGWRCPPPRESEAGPASNHQPGGPAPGPIGFGK